MEQACGWLRWSAEDFWNSTLDEVDAGMTGFVEYTKAVNGRSEKQDGALSDDDYEEPYQMAHAARAAEEREASKR